MLATRPEALDTLARATDVVFDKTGTLSDGRPACVAVEVFDGLDADAAARIVAALEKDSGHPIASAFADIATHAPAQAVVARPGQGVEGDIDGRHWRFGRGDWAAGRDDDGTLWLGDGTRGVARFTLTEKPAMPSEMWLPLLLTALGFYCFFGAVLLLRMRLEVLKREARASWVKEEVLNSLGRRAA